MTLRDISITPREFYSHRSPLHSPLADPMTPSSFREFHSFREHTQITKQALTSRLLPISISSQSQPFDGNSENPFERSRSNNLFFPTEMFIDWTESSTRSFPAKGYARRRLVNDEFEWKECEVLGQNEPSRMFEIQWNDSKIRKTVGREALRFSDETEEEYQLVLSKAAQLKRRHEGYIRYFSRFEIELSKANYQPTPHYTSIESAIFRKISLHLTPSLTFSVKSELWDLYIRSVHQFIFDTQYFSQKAEIVKCPWKDDLEKQGKWGELMRESNSGKHPYHQLHTALEGKLMSQRNPLHPVRLILHQKITKIRWGNYFSVLENLRSTEHTLSLSELKSQFAHGYSKVLYEIDSLIKVLSDQVLKVMEGNSGLQSAVMEFMKEAEVVMESNIQYAVRESTETLVRIIREYYAILPIQGEEVVQYKSLPAGFLSKRCGLSVAQSEHITQPQSNSILRETINILHSSWIHNKLSLYSFHSSPPPFISISIDSKISFKRLNKGKKRKIYLLESIKWESGQRRCKHTKSLPRESISIPSTIKVQQTFRNLMHLNDVCLLNEDILDNFKRKTLLKEEVFDWISTGKDRLYIDLIPGIHEIERNLQELLKAPFKNIQRITSFSPSASETGHVKVKNAGSSLSLIYREVAEVYQYSLYGPLALLALLREFDYLFYPKINEPFMSILSAHVNDYAGIREKIHTIARHKDLIVNSLPDWMQFGILRVELKAFKLQASVNAEVLIQALLKELTNEHLSILQDATLIHSELMEKLSSTPQTFEELETLLDFLDAKKDENVMNEIKTEVVKADVIQTSLEEFQVEMSEEQRLLSWKNRSWDLQLRREKHRLQRRLQRLLPVFQESVQSDINELLGKLQMVKSNMAEFATFSDLQNADRYATLATDVLETLEQLKGQAEVVRAREAILKQPQTDFQELQTLSTQFITMYLFWSYASEWSAAYISWMEKPLYLIDPEAVESKFDKGKRLIDRLKVELSSNVNIMKAINDLEISLNAFESTIPLISNLRLDCLRDRHWKKIWESLGRIRVEKTDVERKTTQTLRELLQKNVLKQGKFVEAVAAEAKNEYEVEKIWTRIDRSVKTPDIQIISHPKFPELHILARLNGLKERLHEFLTTINYLNKSNRHIDPFREQLSVLETTISGQQAVVEDMCEFQQLLSELYPVFRLPEMTDQLPRSHSRFTDMVAYYHQQLALIEASASITTKSETKTLSYPEASYELRKIKDDIYLKIAEKQELCPRLFYLKDSEIVGLMYSASQDGQVDVSKLFPGIDHITISDSTITAISRLNAPISLTQPVILTANSHSKTLDEWLNELEITLKSLQKGRISALSQQLRSSKFTWEYDGDPESRYIATLEWLTSCISTVISEDKLLSELLTSVKTIIQTGIDKIRSLSEEPNREKTGKYHEELMNFFIIKSDFIENLLKCEAEDRNVHWKSSFKLSSVKPGPLQVSVFDYVSEYAYEMHTKDFLHSFILTPELEIRAMHVFLTLQHGQDSFLTSEYNTDQTESVRFLSVVCGRLFIPFTVTTVTQFDRVVKCLIGCAAGGYWGCLESIEALSDLHFSTIGKYAQMIRNALHPNPTRLIIDGYQVKPKPEFALFCVTGKKIPFPPTFHTVFRELAFVKPDIVCVTRVLLQVNGIREGNKTAEMITHAIEELAGPILSLSTGKTLNLHLKATTETVKRVIKAIVALHNSEAMFDFMYVVNNAFRQVYGMGLSTGDLALLDEYLAAIFHSPHNDSLSKVTSKPLEKDVLFSIINSESGIKRDLILRRCQQLHNILTLGSHHWVFVLGPSACGKTTTIDIVARVTAVSNNSGFHMHRLGPVLSPKDILDLVERLHTDRDAFFLQNIEERFTSVPIESPAGRFTETDWIHVDSKEISYSSDILLSIHRTYPKSQVKFLFETESISTCDPATVSEAGLLSLESNEIDDFELYKVLIRRISTDKLSIWVPVFDNLYMTLLEPALQFAEKSRKSMHVSSRFLIDMFIHMLNPLLQLVRKKTELEESIQFTPLNRRLTNLVILSKKPTPETLFSSMIGKKGDEKGKTRSKGLQFDLLKHIGNVRKPTTITPLMTIEAVYLLSLITTIGNFMEDLDVFSRVIMEKIEEKGSEFACYFVRETRSMNVGNVMDVTFSVKQLAWTPILSIFSSAPTHSPPIKGPATSAPRHTLTFFESTACRYLGTNAHRDELIIPTASTVKLSYWVEFCLRNNVDLALFGPHQGGKSSVVMAVAKQLLDVSFSALIPLNLSSRTTCEIVQDLIATSMENNKKKEFGGVGGAHFYAILDDMNLDASMEIYDLFRYWKESGGWYRDGFYTISDLTLVFIHSFIEGRSRPMWLRAMRHFFLLHKPSYQNSELSTIFRHYIDAGASAEEGVGEGMSVADESVATLVRLYGELARNKTEHFWCQVTISNFANCLKFLSQFSTRDDLDLSTYLTMWTFSIRRYFLDQFGTSASEVRSCIYSNLDSLFSKCIESSEHAAEILHHSALIPTESQLDEDRYLLFSDFDVCSKEPVERLIDAFRLAKEVCSEKYPQRLKHLHSILSSTDLTLSSYIYFYLNVLYDLNSPYPCVLLRTSPLSSLTCKALIYMAAESLQVRVFEFNSEEKEDLFSSQLLDNFKSFAPSYFPAEARFEVKRIMEEAMINDKKVALVFTLLDKGQLERPLTRRYMDVVMDIISGVKIRLSGFPTYYKQFIDKFRANEQESPVSSHLYIDEVMEVMLERLRTNITVFFVVSSEENTWSRSPLHSSDVLELFKHEYRKVFNSARVVDFDALNPPEGLVNLVKENERVLREFTQVYGQEILQMVEEELGNTLSQGDFSHEIVAFCCKEMLALVTLEKTDRKSDLEQAISKALELQTRINQIDEYKEEISIRLSKSQHTLRNSRLKLAKSQQSLAAGLNHPYESELTSAIVEQKNRLEVEFAGAKSAWDIAVDGCVLNNDDFVEMEKLVGHPNGTVILYTFSVLIQHPMEDLMHVEKAEMTGRKLFPAIVRKWKETSKRLKTVPSDSIPSLPDSLIFLDMKKKNRLPRALKAIWELLIAANHFKNAANTFTSLTKECDIDLNNIPDKVREITQNLQQSHDEVEKKLKGKIGKLEGIVGKLEEQMSFLSERKEELLDLSTAIDIPKAAWKNSLADLVSEEKLDYGNCLFASFLIVKGLKKAYPEREAVISTLTEVFKASGIEVKETEELFPSLIPDYPNFAHQCALSELSDSPFFYQSAACLYLIQRLKLPFPLIFDPFEVARSYITHIEGNHGLLIGKVSSDQDFERKFRECVMEGRPVLCEDPSTSLYRTAYSAIVWRNQQFLMQLRGMNVAKLKMKTVRGEVSVHPNFRLYICCSDMPPQALVTQTTQVNFDAVDQESWNSVLVTPLMKALDEAQHKDHIMSAVRKAQVNVATRVLENSLITAVLRCDPGSILDSPALGSELGVLFRKLRFKMPSARKSVLSIRAFDRAPSALMPEETDSVSTPKEKLMELLQETYCLKSSLVVCEKELVGYTITCRQLYNLVLSAAGSFFRELGVPSEQQWNTFAERTGYIVFLKVYQSMPRRLAGLFTLVYVLFRTYLQDVTLKPDILTLISDFLKSLSAEYDTETAIQHLKARYPTLFTCNFATTSTAFRNFMEKELFSDIKLPDSVPVLQRVMLFAYLRPDLLPDFAANAAQEFLGSRFAYLPVYDHSFSVAETPVQPILLFYRDTSPVCLIERLADVRNVNLLRCQPMFSSIKSRSGKVEIRGIGRSYDSISTALTQLVGRNDWLVVENLHLISGLEAEYVTKYILTKSSEPGYESIRVFLLCKGDPQEFSEWKPLFDKCRRIYFPECRSVKEYMQRWYAAGDTHFYSQIQSTQHKQFWANCALEELVKPPTGAYFRSEPKDLRRSTARRSSVMASETLNEVSLLSKHAQIAYSSALLAAILSLRRKYVSDIPLLLPQTDVQMVISDFLTCFPVLSGPKNALQPVYLKLLSDLLLPLATHFQLSVFISLAEGVFAASQSLQTTYAANSRAEYPLLPSHTLDSLSLETILERFPLEDPSLTFGLFPTKSVPSKGTYFSSISTLQTHIKYGHFASSMQDSLSFSALKQAASDRICGLIASILSVLPDECVPEVTHRRLSFNTSLPRRINWFHSKTIIKDVDLKNSILDSIPTLPEVFQILKTAENIRKGEFLKVVQGNLREILSYLNYERSVLSAEQREILRDLAKGVIPESWKFVTLHSAKSIPSLEPWKNRVLKWFESEIIPFELNLNLIFSPEIALKAILRAFLLSELRRFSLITMKEDSNHPFLTLDQCGFAVKFRDSGEISGFQTKISGLNSRNIRFGTEKGVESCEGREKMRVLVFTPRKIPKKIRKNPAYPGGLLGIWEENESEGGKWDSVAHINAMKRRSWRDLQDTDWETQALLRYCPVKAGDLWLLVGTGETQGDWGKKQVGLELD